MMDGGARAWFDIQGSDLAGCSERVNQRKRAFANGKRLDCENKVNWVLKNLAVPVVAIL